MDGFTEKKWFVYLGDHHEGPFSLQEVQTKISQGQLTTTNYVWAEGMADWKQMNEVQAFESITMAPVTPPMPEIPATAPILSAGPELTPAIGDGSAIALSSTSSASVDPIVDFSSITLEPAKEATNPALVSPALEAAGPAIPVEVAPQLIEAGMLGSSNVLSDFSEDATVSAMLNPKHAKKLLAGQLIKAGAVLLVLGGIGIAFNEGYLNTLVNSQTGKTVAQGMMNLADPVLEKLGISQLPKLDDVDTDEYEQLKAAAKAKLDKDGPQIALALSKSDLLSPDFYVATNLPDGTVLDLYIEGIPDSLLNQLSFNAKTEVTITKKLGKSSSIQFPAGARGFPRGQYTIYVVDPETQPASVRPLLGAMKTSMALIPPVSVPKGLRIVANKAYFLGGPKDATYTARLQEFHAKLTAKAQQELVELKQIANTYDSQLAETDKKFGVLRKAKRITPAQRKAWDAFHGQWSALNTQLGQTFSKLTPEAIQNNYFYGYLYQLGNQVGEKIAAVHALQSSFFAGRLVDPKAFEIQLGEANSIARSSVDEMKARIEQIEKLPPTPNGLPKREGT